MSSLPENNDSMARAKQQLAEMRQGRTDRIGAEIANIAQALQDVSVDDRVRMPERVFYYVWLPFFAGDENLPYKVTFQHWVNFAGNPYRGVDVVNAQGEVLFTVPPVLDRGVVQPLSNTRSSIAHVVRSAEQYGQIHPVQGEMYLNKELSNRALVMKVPPNVLANLNTWNAIFKRYGRPALADVASSSTNPQQNGSSASSSAFEEEFEPL